MLKLATALSLAMAPILASFLTTATPVLAQISRETTTTTTIQAPAPRPAPAPAQVTVTKLPPDPNAGPGDPPHTLATMEEKIVHPGTVTTSGSSTTVTVPDRIVGTESSESTEFRLGVP